MWGVFPQSSLFGDLSSLCGQLKSPNLADGTLMSDHGCCYECQIQSRVCSVCVPALFVDEAEIMKVGLRFPTS